MTTYLVGIDIGATNVKCMIFETQTKKIIKKESTKFCTLNTAEEEFKKNVIEFISNLIYNLNIKNNQVEGIGIATGALFNRKEGTIINWPNNKKWNGFELSKNIKKYFFCKVLIEEDANSAAMGEFTFGKGKDFSNFGYITISTGIGCGLILDRKLYIGNSGFAGEIGHIPISNGKNICKCGGKDCLQALASGKALIDKYNQLTKSSKGHYSIECLSEVENASSKDELFREAGELIGHMIIMMTMLLDLPLIVLGGGVISQNPQLKAVIEKKVYQHLNILKRSLEIETSDLSDANGILGILGLLHSDLYQEKLICLNMKDGDFI